MSDTRYVYGARCTWNGPIQAVGKHPTTGLPCCPKCLGMLFELPAEADWIARAESYEARSGTTGYTDFMRWLRGRCFGMQGQGWLLPVIEIYTRETGKLVANPNGLTSS